MNECHHFFRLDLGIEEFYHFPLGVHHKFGEIPGNHLCSAGLRVEKLTVVSEVNEEGMSMFTVYFNLLHHWELNVEVLGDEFLNFSRGAALLAKELVAGEGKDLKPLISPPVVSLNHFFIVVRGKSSLAGYIDDHGKFFIPEGLEVKQFAPDVLDLEVEEAHATGSLEFFLPRFEDYLGK